MSNFLLKFTSSYNCLSLSTWISWRRFDKIDWMRLNDFFSAAIESRIRVKKKNLRLIDSIIKDDFSKSVFRFCSDWDTSTWFETYFLIQSVKSKYVFNCFKIRENFSFAKILSFFSFVINFKKLIFYFSSCTKL